MTAALPGELFEDFRGRVRDRWRIIRLARTGGVAAVGAALLMQVVAGALPVAFVVLTGAVIQRVPQTVRAGIGTPEWRGLRNVLVAAAVVFFAQQALLPVQAWAGELIRRRIDDIAADRVMAASFATHDLGVLEDQEVVESAANGVEMLKVTVWTPGAACTGAIALVSRYLQTILAGVVVGWIFSWWAGALLVLAGLTIRFGYRLGLSVFVKSWRTVDAERRKRWYFRDLLLEPRAAKEVRVFGLLPWLRERFTTTALESVYPTWAVRRRIFYGPYVLYTLVAFAATAVALAMTANAAAEQVLAIGSAALVAQAALSSLQIGGFIADSDVQTEYGTVTAQALQRFEDTVAARAGATSADRDPAGLPRTGIRFEGVTFGYGDGAPVLKGLDLDVPAGQSLAVVGLNGAGKSTLVKLLARFYEPRQGRITVDGVDLRDFPAQRWQRQIAAVFQDFVQFELPVRDNVGFGATGLRGDTARIESALERAGAADVVRRLPDGLDTILSRQYEGGTDLSGGQWQRIAIARAFMAVDRGARLLVLDEPTSNLDVRAEVEFFDRFLELTRGLTTIVISHRFSTVRRADRIVVLDEGRVVESGSHQELVAAGGRYAELFHLQAARFADDAPDVEEATR
ncbi:ABC transporter ATP-binding protein [Dactylosporangium sp. CA-052675]|uniref:ABC transporter ATP-binding protein n=1 Tax=Dactylosporangium sp. CA-052675 TaxID=3239927 RepID=UPI003D8B12FA